MVIAHDASYCMNQWKESRVPILGAATNRKLKFGGKQ